MSWLTQERSGLAADRILDTAARLYSLYGVDGPGMEDVARAAGCSRATLYRYYPNRRALQVAFAQREAAEIVGVVAERTQAIDEPGARAVEAVLACLDEVRARPHLARWYAAGGADALREVLREAQVAETFGDPIDDPDRARWMLRIVLSFLADPGGDEDEERRLITRFLPPVASG